MNPPPPSLALLSLFLLSPSLSSLFFSLPPFFSLSLLPSFHFFYQELYEEIFPVIGGMISGAGGLLGNIGRVGGGGGGILQSALGEKIEKGVEDDTPQVGFIPFYFSLEILFYTFSYVLYSILTHSYLSTLFSHIHVLCSRIHYLKFNSFLFSHIYPCTPPFSHIYPFYTPSPPS